MANEKTYRLNFEAKKQASLYQDLMRQMADQYGILIYYIPIEQYTQDELEKVFNEVKYRNYSNVFGMKAIPDDMTIISGTDIFSKFGYSVQDEMTIWVTRAEFGERLTGQQKASTLDIVKGTVEPYDDSYKTNHPPQTGEFPIPKIGSLVWTPMWNSLWEITYEEHQENLVLGYRTIYRINMKKYISDKSDSIILPTNTGDGQDLIDIINKVNKIDSDIKNDEIAVDKKNTEADTLKTTVKDPNAPTDVLGDY